MEQSSPGAERAGAGEGSLASDAVPSASPEDGVAEEGGGGQEEGDGEKEVRDEDVKQLYDDEAQLCEMPEAPDPRLFVEGLTLRRYQRQALAWMIDRERPRYVTETRETLSLEAAGGAPRAEPIAPPSDALVRSNVEPVASDDLPSSLSDESAAQIYVKDGALRVPAWESSKGRGGIVEGEGGAALHPLWERRAAASVARTPVRSGASEPSFLELVAEADGVVERNESPRRVFSEPEAFYVNAYSRRFQREFPPASVGCRGGILADEMGMGKVRGGRGFEVERAASLLLVVRSSYPSALLLTG